MVNETEDWFIILWCPRSFWPRFPVKARAYPVPPRWLDVAMAFSLSGSDELVSSRIPTRGDRIIGDTSIGRAYTRADPFGLVRILAFIVYRLLLLDLYCCKGL